MQLSTMRLRLSSLPSSLRRAGLPSNAPLDTASAAMLFPALSAFARCRGYTFQGSQEEYNVYYDEEKKETVHIQIRDTPIKPSALSKAAEGKQRLIVFDPGNRKRESSEQTVEVLPLRLLFIAAPDASKVRNLGPVKTSLSGFPFIRGSDPVAVYLGAVKGDLLQFEREGSILSYFRRVI